MSVLLSIVMPAYNEEEIIETVVRNWSAFLDTHFQPLGETRLIVVNDGSKDSTGAKLDEIAPKYPRLVVVHQKNGGHGNAVVHAYRKAVEIGSEWVFQTDSDDQFVAEDVLKLWNKREESDFIMGFRQVRHDATFRLFVTRVLKYSLFAVYGTMISDSNIPFRLIRGSFLKKLLAQLPEPLPFAPNIFLAVMARKAGQKTFDIPITHKERATGEVSIQKMKLLKVCWQSFKELFRFRQELNEKVRAIKAA
ncbi:glycosyltransferase family 2 protein [Siphonobacter aquaeclarae]|jgi:dolichol-phosphate mannosyltransferase|uniref:Glycosyltransferase involved in cell wall bisynthesis n=1 Tax=Siphonobacter aquaeclarae TaxID=563176 RepID=A0A1G9YDU2_9BACT|nr:glycosyltransferase family 2 protein [Siphonobacter aquaeclarae]MBO9638339.1 glycosyltransferase family 2 protein [Siphonobacter aquaeclarae]SDN06641.1 Glycosyltransferase involved in cell wall bisynthesis [Siphonobacter aquaeclarae]